MNKRIEELEEHIEGLVERLVWLEQENNEWKDLLGRLEDFEEWKRWKTERGKKGRAID